MKALFIGRFQPFHKGHLHAIKKAMKKFDEVIIAIGSSNKSNTYGNPFTFEERKKMVEACFGKNCKIIDAEDMISDEEWAKSLAQKIKFDVVITGSEWVKKCFSGIKEVVAPNFLEQDKYNGTKIREKIAKGEKWKVLVPPEVNKIIEKIKGVERIKKLAS